MADETNSTDRPDDPADALADLAADAPVEIKPPGDDDAVADPLTALTAMDADQAAASAIPAPSAEDGEDAEAPEEIPIVQALPQNDSHTVRQAHAAQFAANQARAHAHTFKKVMIPFLLAVAGLLLVVGVMSASMGGSAVGKNRNWLLLLALVSFPIAAVLLLGAWLFYRDVKK